MLLIRVDKPYAYNMHEKEKIESDAPHSSRQAFEEARKIIDNKIEGPKKLKIP